MEDQIPSSISTCQLQSLFDNAVSEDGPKSVEELSIDGKEEAAFAVLAEANDPQIHKFMLHIIVANMIDWHSKVSNELSDDPKQSLAWGRDAGKWQAIMNILQTIEVSDDDPTCLVSA